MTMTAKEKYKKVSTMVRRLRRQGASALEYPLLLRAANRFFKERDFESAKMARELEKVAWKLDGLSRFPAGAWNAPALSCARTFARYKGYLAGTIPNADGIRFRRLTGRWPTAKDGRKYQSILEG
ncbi:MAG: hypothetical protein IPK84_02690 [Candidatus Moraniibacteriota bacterium]|nr:MAG: hypothetical protein IPK84_02690 [Candidatus Moranbacteria bacterium]